MTTGQQDDGIVRVLRTNNDKEKAPLEPFLHTGLGFLLGSRTIVTCAHVVNAALGREKL